MGFKLKLISIAGVPAQTAPSPRTAGPPRVSPHAVGPRTAAAKEDFEPFLRISLRERRYTKSKEAERAGIVRCLPGEGPRRDRGAAPPGLPSALPLSHVQYCPWTAPHASPELRRHGSPELRPTEAPNPPRAALGPRRARAHGREPRPQRAQARGGTGSWQQGLPPSRSRSRLPTLRKDTHLLDGEEFQQREDQVPVQEVSDAGGQVVLRHLGPGKEGRQGRGAAVLRSAPARPRLQRQDPRLRTAARGGSVGAGNGPGEGQGWRW